MRSARKPRTSKLTALTAAGLLSLTACAGGGDGADSDGPVTLRMTVWTADENHLKLLNGIAADYRKKNPNVREIRFDTLPGADYTTALTTQIAGGKAPDIAWIAGNSAEDFVTSGALAPIEDDADILPAAKKPWQTDGKLYAYPFSNSPFAVFANTDLLKKAGQPTPTELVEKGDWNWKTAMEIGSSVHDRTGKAGMVIRDFDYKLWDLLATYWRGWDAKAWSADGKTCAFDDPEMVKAMTFLHESTFDDKAIPPPGTTADFFAGDSAMTVSQISRASLLGKDFGWELVPLPAGPKGRYSLIGQAGVGVLAQGDHVDVATDFLKFMTNKENSAELARFFPPPRKSLMHAGTLAESNPLLTRDQLQQVVIEGIKTGEVGPNHTNQAEIGQSVRSALDPLWRPEADVEEVLDGVCDQIQPQLAK